MSFKCAGYFALMFGILSITSAADAAYLPYKYKCPNPPIAEVNGSFGGNTARDLIGAFRSAANGYGCSPVAGIDEPLLLMKCQAKTSLNTVFAEQCDLYGGAMAASQHFAQSWIVSSTTDLGQSLWTQASGMATYGSPLVVPLYGAKTRWGTVYEMTADVSLQNKIESIASVTFFDANEGVNGPKTVAGVIYRGTYFLKIANLPANDPLYNKYGFSYEPPQAAMMQAGPSIAEDLQWLAGKPMLGEHDQLTPDVAEGIALDALELEGLLDRSEYRHFATRGVPDGAVRVDGRTGTGEARDYFLVPILDGESGLGIGSVLLNARDGSFEEIRAFARPEVPHQRDAAEAEAQARPHLRPGERLRGGTLRWSPACDAVGCLSPDQPFYEYTATGPDARVATIYVPLGDAPAVRR